MTVDRDFGIETVYCHRSRNATAGCKVGRSIWDLTQMVLVPSMFDSKSWPTEPVARPGLFPKTKQLEELWEWKYSFLDYTCSPGSLQQVFLYKDGVSYY